MRLQPIKLQPLEVLQDKLVQKHDITTVPTLRHSAMSKRLVLPAKQSTGQYRQNAEAVFPQPIKQSTKPPAAGLPKKRRNYRHAFYIATCQLIYSSVATALAWLSYWYLAPWPVYRVVAFVVLVIAWSNIASTTARKKSVDMLATVKVQAIRIGDRKKSPHAVLSEDTTTYLHAIKASFLEKNNEI